MMNFITKFSLTVLSVALLTGTGAAITSTPRATISQTQRGTDNQLNLQSVSGQITAVSGKSFTLAMSQSSSAGSPKFQSAENGRTMTFMVDENTTVSGKLAVGAAADVIYRTQGDQNIAVSVRISS